MITALLYTWYLLSPPVPLAVCTLWVSRAPDRAAIVEACGESVYNRLDKLQLDIIAPGGVIACTLAGPAVLDPVRACGLPGALDQYRLSLSEPPRVFVICAATVTHTGPPSDLEISAAGCPAGAVGSWELVNTQEQAPPAAPICTPAPLATGPGLFDQPQDPADLYTSLPLSWLGGRLIWYGMAAGDCPGGYSGIDPATGAASACGMVGAAGPVQDWQNRYNPEIYAAALAAGVPARLLKSILIQESQLWPGWESPAGERGTGQLTPAAADLILRFTPDLYPGYPAATQAEQARARAALFARLDCPGCSLIERAEHERNNFIYYALAVRAAYCLTGEVSPAGPAWDLAAAVYHAGGSCVTPAGVCPAGIEYIRRVIE